MRCIKLTLAYDGTNYCGWQIQPNGPTVQAAVETAIERLTHTKTTVTVAGRTDSGVHAVGQVAAFQTESTIPIEKFRRGLQTFLPEDIVVASAIEVHNEFHATFWTIKKRYRYVMFDGPFMLPFFNRYVHNVGRRLDIEAMTEAAAHLLGTHDFRCFESHFPNKATSVRTIMETSLLRTARWPGWLPLPMEHTQVTVGDCGPAATVGFDNDFVCFEIEADGFLYNMVRAIVGSLIKIGLGQWEPDHMAHIIASMDRSEAGHTAPANGLYMVNVDYRDEP